MSKKRQTTAPSAANRSGSLLRFATELPQRAATLEQALSLTLDEVCGALGWPRDFASRREPPPGSRDGDGQSGRAAPGGAVYIASVDDGDDDPAVQAAIAAGLASRIAISISEEGRPAAVIEFFSQHEADEGTDVRDVLTLLATQLSLVASRQRLRQAVRTAARHSRAQITALKEARAAFRLFNERTGLPMSAILQDRIQQAIRRRQRSPKNQFAVLSLSLDGLEKADRNENSEGRAEVLQALGRRLTVHCRPSDTVAHAGEDGLVILLEAIRTVEEALKIAGRMRREAQRPFSNGEVDIALDAYLGIVLGSTAYQTPRALLDDSALAVMRARRGGSRIQLFDSAMEAAEERRGWLESELAGALQNRDLFVEYLPIVSLQSGRLAGLEALIRWRHAEAGLVPPAEFMAAAEDSPIGFEVGNWMLSEVCAQIRRWQDSLAPLDVPPVAVNVTARQLFHEQFLERVRDILERHAIQGDRIRFDISESDLMKDASRAATVLDRLHGMGIRVAVDDFGTGYSSLSLLHALPVSALKIDRSFVSQPRERLRKWGVARTIVELAKILEVEVIAEGIETREQFLHLRQAGCTQAQGFHFSGPVGAAQAAEFIKDGYPLDLEAPAR